MDAGCHSLCTLCLPSGKHFDFASYVSWFVRLATAGATLNMHAVCRPMPQAPPCCHLVFPCIWRRLPTHTRQTHRTVALCVCEVNWFLMRITQIKNNFIFIRLGSCDWHIWLVPGQKETNKSVARQTPSEANKQREQFNSMKLNFCMVCHLWLLPPPPLCASYIHM